MDFALLIVAGVSLLLAVLMGAALLRVQQEAKARADARVALLRAAASAGEVRTAADPADLPRVEASSGIASRPAASSPMFAAHDAPPLWGRRAAIAGALAVTGAVVLLLLASPAIPTKAPQAAAQPVRLELLALGHTQERGGLVITGTVQNPRSGSTISRVAASALVYGPDGSMVASGRAGLDHATLGPGEESPFVIKVPLTGAVSRYRVGFRGPGGEVIAHVDRRSEIASALNPRTGGSKPWVP